MLLFSKKSMINNVNVGLKLMQIASCTKCPKIIVIYGLVLILHTVLLKLRNRASNVLLSMYFNYMGIVNCANYMDN